MPTGMVKTEADEKKWKLAKKIVNERIASGKLKVKKGSDRYWKIVVGMFKHLKNQAEE